MFTMKHFGIGLLTLTFSQPIMSAASSSPTSKENTPPTNLNNSKNGHTNPNATSGGNAGDAAGKQHTPPETSIKATLISNPTGSNETRDDADLKNRITEILQSNPKIIVNALQKFQEDQIRDQEAKVKASLMKYKSEIEKDSNAVVLGKKDADVKLVVFIDPNCPHCRPFSLALNKARENFPNMAILIRHWPILGKDSEEVVRGLWAIKLQGEDKFNAATHAIATSEEKFTFPKLLSWVKDHNLNVKKFEEDASSQATKDIIEDTKKLATAIGFEGTPTSLLIDKSSIRLVMPTDEKSLENIIKSATKDTPATPA